MIRLQTNLALRVRGAGGFLDWPRQRALATRWKSRHPLGPAVEGER